MAATKHSRKTSGPTHRSTLSLQKTEIAINVYDLLPPGRLASTLWSLGTSLLHSGVVINHREYAFGGHDRRGMTGVYWAKPRLEPPGGTFRCEILHGFTVQATAEIDAIIREASEMFQGTGYNLLNRNCNHFTSYLCQRLTGRPGPAWLNRAATIGIALPCIVPKEWISPPDYETANGELLGEASDDDSDDHDENSRMLNEVDFGSERHIVQTRADETISEEWDSEEERRKGGTGKGKAPLKDTSGRVMPPSERAPVRTR